VPDNFLDNRFLADGQTGIRQYLSTLEPSLQRQDTATDYGYRNDWRKPSF
jgi:hypothetical protein